MVIANIISYVLVLLGAVNWGLYGIFDFNLVSWIFQGPRSVGSMAYYLSDNFRLRSSSQNGR